MEQRDGRTGNTGGEGRSLWSPEGADSRPACPGLAPCSAAQNGEQQPGFQKSRRQEIRSHQATRALQTQQQQLLLREPSQREILLPK